MVPLVFGRLQSVIYAYTLHFLIVFALIDIINYV